MSLAQKKEQARIRAEREKKAVMLKKAQAAGLLHEETELPPEDVDRQDVSKGIAYSLLSMIPYTSAWYESQAAETEMDDLQKIRIERSKAEDLLAMTKNGRHEEALATMRAETDRDFFFFNKLRHQQESEGKTEVEEMKVDPFAKFQKGVTRNRIRKANAASFSALVSTGVQLPAAPAANNAGANRRMPRDTPCSWRGKSPQGEYLQCTNLRAQDTSKPYTDESGKETFELFTLCPFHLPDCVGEVHRADGATTRMGIQLPNEEALCTECYFQKKKRKPPALKANAFPGVGPAVTKLPPKDANPLVDSLLEEDDSTAAAADSSVDLSKLDAQSHCRWRPNTQNGHEREYECGNIIIVHPDTKVFVPYCIYHVKSCLLKHNVGDDTSIAIPNEHGLCSMHYTAKFGKPPPVLPFPLPGMKKRIAKNAWRIQVGHWAAPTWAPEENRNAAIYEEPEPSDGYAQAVVAQAKYLYFLWQKRKFGEMAAIKIQVAFRRYHVYNMHKELLFQKRLQKRIRGSIVIQAQMRRFLGKKHVQERRVAFNKSAAHIQSRYRGYKYRWHMKRIWASNRIKKFFKRLSIFKFKDTIIMIMQLKRMFKQRIQQLIRIQKLWRGYQGRLLVFRVRLRRLLISSSARIVTRFIRRYAHYIYTRSLVVTDDEIYYLQSRHLSRIVTNAYIDLLERRHQFALETASAQACQRLIRGYLARSGTNRLRELREIMRQWCKPEYANEFLNEFLVNDYFKNKDEPEKPPTPPPKIVQHIRPYLGDQKDAMTVDSALFSSALEQWYTANRLILLEAEKKSILRQFKLPGTNKLSVGEFEGYIEMHKIPCRKHGRRICGDCIFFRECQQPKCECKAMRHSSDDTSAAAVCKNCSHPPSVHRKCPLQIKPSKGQQSLLGILNAPRMPDLSKPSVEGITLHEALIHPPNEEEKRIEYLDSLAKTQKQTLKEFWSTMTLQKELSYLQVSGKTIAARDDYWDQPSTFDVITADVETSALTLDVTTYTVPPHYNITPAEFWHSTSKNPNKTLRDYDEKFEHNMPLPIVHDGVMHYTFEGPKIYLNIILQLIKMEEKIHMDDPEFLRLIMNYIQVFERHWRKMVVDIRVGILNRHLQVPENIKSTFESINYPRPQLAKTLDATFRNLGFHKKVLGKDIKLQKFAEKRFQRLPDPKARRLSLPSRQLANPLNLKDTFGFGTAGSRLNSANSTVKDDGLELLLSTVEAVDRSTQRSSSKKTRATTPPPMSAGRGLSARIDDFAGTDPLSPSNRSFSPNRQLLTPLDGQSRMRSAASKTKPKTPAQQLAEMSAAMKNGMLENLREREKDHSVRGPNRRSRQEKRRGSDPDVSRPATTAEINEAHYKNETMPRDDYRHLVQTEDLRFICPFPACGICFSSKEAAFQHLSVHQNRQRLQIANPLGDSHHRHFWPTDVPWLHNNKYKDRAIPPGAHSCPIENCTEVFGSKERLKTHIRLVHAKIDPSSLHRNYFKGGGECISVPPYEPPFDCKIRWCPNHLMPVRKCTVCLELENITTQPKPPFKFYLGPIPINFKVRHEALKHIAMFSHAKALEDRDDEIIIGHHEEGVLVRETRYYGGASVVGDFKALPIGFLTDKLDNGWLAVQRLMNQSEAEMRGRLLPADFDRNHELVLANDIDSIGTSMWVPMASVCGVVKVFHMDKDLFRIKRKARELPSKNTFFIRSDHDGK